MWLMEKFEDYLSRSYNAFSIKLCVNVRCEPPHKKLPIGILNFHVLKKYLNFPLHVTL